MQCARQADTRYDSELKRWMWILLFTTFFCISLNPSLDLMLTLVLLWRQQRLPYSMWKTEKIFQFIFHHSKHAHCTHRTIKEPYVLGWFPSIVDSFVLHSFTVPQRDEAIEWGVDINWKMFSAWFNRILISEKAKWQRFIENCKTEKRKYHR